MKPGADQYAVGAEHQRRRQPTPILYAASRDHQHVAPQPLGLVDDRRHQRQGRTLAAMPAALGALRDDDVDAQFDGGARHGHSLDLADHRNAALPDF